MVVLVLTSDQKSNNVQICTKQTYYLQEVLFHYNNKQVNKAKLLLIEIPGHFFVIFVIFQQLTVSSA